MSRIIQLTLVIALTAGMSACSKNDAPAPASESSASSEAISEVKESEPAQATASQDIAKPASEKDVTYRPINATLRDTGERIVIMVPDDEDIESGRMLEYRQDADGTYYLKSIIPQ